MTALLALVEPGGERPLRASLQAVGAGLALARQLDAPLDVAVVAESAAPAHELAALQGVRSVLHVAGAGEPGSQAHVLSRLVRDGGYDVVLAALTPDSMALGPQLAVNLGYGLASNVMGVTVVDGRIVARRHGFGDRLAIDQAFDGLPGAVILLGLGGWAVPDAGGEATIRSVPMPEAAPPARTRHVLFEPAESEGALVRAGVIVSVGRGIGDSSRVPLFEELARKLGGELGASRPLVDAGWVHRSHLVGVSGFTVEPRVYLAFGISGSTQHLAGVGQGTTIVAINTDRDAPIFEAARYGATVDTIELANALLDLLGR